MNDRPPQQREARALIARACRDRARIRDQAASVATALLTVETQLDDTSLSDDARAALLARQRELWALRDVYAKGMRAVAYTMAEIAEAFGVSIAMARKIVLRDKPNL